MLRIVLALLVVLILVLFVPRLFSHSNPPAVGSDTPASPSFAGRSAVTLDAFAVTGSSSTSIPRT